MRTGRESEVDVGGETAGAAEEFERAANWLRAEVTAVLVAVVGLGSEPETEEWTRERRTTRGAMGRQYAVRLSLPGVVLPADVTAAADAMRASGWGVEAGEDARGPRFRAWRDGFEAGLFCPQPGRLSAWGTAPTVWFRAQWLRPPRAATAETVGAGYELCGMCDGWGSCFVCEGLGFLDGRPCGECGLGMDCSYCRGSGRRSVAPPQPPS
ncbi:hypothetical protein ACFVU3_11875 [Streptomyces sp. NPDC058052]|uniref:hypothetical protein n=1 Tax=Streptomyces sp. NPDC058052 TaxID=3346316 RepID=UPI0036ED4F6D